MQSGTLQVDCSVSLLSFIRGNNGPMCKDGIALIKWADVRRRSFSRVLFEDDTSIR